MTLKEKLSKIQQEIRAPKNRHNDFSNYDYRNAEDILNAVKPFEDKYNVAFIVWDDIKQIGDRFYVRATAEIMDTESDDQICTTAYAREPDEKRGMDPSQISGTASSYARKYCLNGLLLLDDVKDPDSNEYAEQTGAKKRGTVKTDGNSRIEAKRNTIKNICKRHGIDTYHMCEANGKMWPDMSEDDLQNMLDSLMHKYGDDA